MDRTREDTPGPATGGLPEEALKPAETDHPVHPIVRRRYSPVVFRDRPVDPAHLRSVLEAARWAASSFNEQPWVYLVARREEPEAFAHMLATLVPGNRTWARHAPVLMVSVARRRFQRNDKQNRHAWHDVGQASATLALQAAALGLQLHQMAGFDADAVRRTYEVPEDWEPVAAMALGHPGPAEEAPEPELAERARRERTRRPIAAFAFEGSWGRSLV